MQTIPTSTAQLDQRERAATGAARRSGRSATVRLGARGGTCGAVDFRAAVALLALGLGHGQPEETLTRHHLLSRRGGRRRSCSPAARAPALVTRSPWCARGSARMAASLARAAACSARWRSARAADVGDLRDERVAGELELAPARAAAGRRGASAPRCATGGIGRRQRLRELALEPRDLLAQRRPRRRRCRAASVTAVMAMDRILVGVPRNDPTDTGGLFIGRRPGTGPVHYRETPEPGGPGAPARRRPVRGARAARRGAAVPVGLGPAAASRGCGSARRSSTTAARTCSGSSSPSSASSPRCSSRSRWRRALDRFWRLLRRAAGHDQRDGVMVPIFGATAVIALVVFSVWFLLLEGPAPSHRRRLMRRFLSYYRQFDELSPEEISQSLRERREEERRREVATQPDARPLRRRLARPAARGDRQRGDLRAAARGQHLPGRRRRCARRSRAPHDVEPARVVIGHGASELLRSAAARRRPARGARRLAGLGTAAGPGPRGGRAAGRGDPRGAVRAPPPAADDASSPARRDPTGAVVGFDDLQGLADALAPDAWLILDEALAGFLPDGEDGLLDHPRVIHVRSFSKDHAMAGFRIGYAIVPRRRPGPRAGARRERAGAGGCAVGGRARRAERAPAARAGRGGAGAVGRRSSRCHPGHGPYVWLAGAGLARATRVAAGVRRAGFGVGGREPRAHHAARRGGDRPAVRRVAGRVTASRPRRSRQARPRRVVGSLAGGRA